MLAADRISDEFVALLHERTAGVPLALEESVLLLADRRDVFRRGEEWARHTVDRLRVPTTVRDMVLERVARLTPQAQRVLETSAVLAEPTTAQILEVAGALDADETRCGLSAALASGLLREASPGRFAFRHVLAMLAVYEAIPVSERRQLHGRAARHLEQLTPQPIWQLAHHYREAHEIPVWARYAEAAADLAAETGNHQAVMAMLPDLLDEVTSPADQFGRLARKLGQAAGFAAANDGTADRVIALLRVAVARDDLKPVDRGQLRLLLCRILINQGRLDAAYAEIERSIPDLDDTPVLAARAMIGLAWPWLGGRPATEHLAWLDRAAKLLPRLPSSSERITLAADHATALLMLGEESGWRGAGELPTGASTAAGRRDLARGFANLSQLAVAWGRYRPARTWLEAGARLVDSTTYPVMDNILRISSAYMDYCTGAWSDLDATVAEFAQAIPLTRMSARLIQGLLALAGGSTQTAEQAFREVIDGLDVSRLADDRLTAEAALARLQLAGGAATDALAATDASMEAIMSTGLWLWATDLAQVRVDALIETESVEQAEALLRQFTAWIVDRDAPAPAAAVIACQARVAEGSGDPRRAATLFGQAARAWAELPRPYDALLAAERRGRCLLAVGADDEALTALADAQQGLFDLGARRDANRIARVLRQRDVEVTRIWRGGRRGYGDELSPRELEVVRFVVSGLTNRQVAEALFISPRTVAEHVSRAMRKLGVTSRTALAAAAMRATVLSDTNESGGQPTP
ncbi:LuxR C-terminal-related transcriptional regulator [Micromonospora sp. SL1-18]|uniref:LuxR C-terminal-related transcriptional regulator n=1 Tax=Micromonospora sp. SL1-18 TaxID=3399128 RepID=UPI003A4D99CE